MVTGRRLRPRDILRDAVFNRSGLKDLERRVGKAAPGGALCFGDQKIVPRALTASTIDNDDKEERALDVMPTAEGLEFGVVPPLLGYVWACGDTVVTVPYDKISDLVRPEILALIQASAASPVPSPS